MADQGVTRGYGILERFLAAQRAGKADALIPDSLRRGRILDIGSGTYPFFLTTIEFAEKYGIDKLFQAARDGGRPGSDILLKQHDIEAGAPLPFDDEHFDVVTMLAVFEHIAPEILPKILNEIYRVLKKGGLCVITTPAPWAHALLKGMARLRLVSPLEIQEHKTHYSVAGILNIIGAGGFPVEKIRSGYFELAMNLWFTVTK